ncbi:hypothetical protein C7B67_22380 [filamentous cyanobacterium Phorm 6]|nr:hypothetical protein C7B67_22380 [filamentous cyanobacterium Phorm 6]
MLCEELTEGSSAADCVTDVTDVTDRIPDYPSLIADYPSVLLSLGTRKKEEGFLVAIDLQYPGRSITITKTVCSADFSPLHIAD